MKAFTIIVLSTFPNIASNAFMHIVFNAFVHIASNAFVHIALYTIANMLFREFNINAIELNAILIVAFGGFRHKFHYPNCEIPK